MFFNSDTSGKMIFDAVASIYDAGRPGYPEAMFNDLLSLGALGLQENNCLEIGSGSGQATRQLLDYVSSVECVEPGESMCAMLRQHFQGNPRVNIHRSELESFQSAREFSFVFAGNSLHWIQPDLAYDKIEALLAEEAWFTGVWNMPRFSQLVYGFMQDLILPHDKEFSIPVAGEFEVDYFAQGFADFKKRGFRSCAHFTYENRRVIAPLALRNLIWSYINVTGMSVATQEELFARTLKGFEEFEPNELWVDDTFMMGCGKKPL